MKTFIMLRSHNLVLRQRLEIGEPAKPGRKLVPERVCGFKSHPQRSFHL